MANIVLERDARRVEVPAPHPERAFTREREAEGRIVERQWLRFLDLDDDEADRLLAFHHDALAAAFVFRYTDETGRAWNVRAATGAKPVRQAPGNWEITLALEHVQNNGSASDPDVWREGWTRFAREQFHLVLPAPLPEQSLAQSPIQAIGLAADGTRHVYDTGRVRHERTLRFAELGNVQRDALARLHALGAGGRDEFALTEPDGAVRNWRFADQPLVSLRIADDAWRVECTLVREAPAGE